MSSASNSSTLRHVLPNGMVALIRRNPGAPTVSVRGELRVGAALEPPELGGLAVFTGAALTRGAGERSFHQIVAETEGLGCSVSAGGGTQASGFSGKALAEDLPLILEILADMLIRPTFPAAEVERLRGQFLTGLRESEQDTGYRASIAARAMLYPPGHPFSRPSSGSLDSVAAITRDDLARFHRRYHPALSSIAVVGDIDPPAVVAELERHFARWQPDAPPEPVSIPDAPHLVGVRRDDIAMPGKVQADLIWAVHGLRRSAPDYYGAMIANMILGQLGMGGRLGEQVREEQGMAYYCYSDFEADLGAGPWVAAAGVSPENIERAAQAILAEIELFRQEGPTDEELDDARDYLTGSLVIGLETSDGIAGSLLGIERHGLGLDYIERYPAIIAAVDRDQVHAAAQKYLSTESYVLSVAGPV
ncbi:insulinase family protein [Chloroflexales bacterium ZM16-3]|nr:insulinase family protein [Chloroflexales bacterium ZM16-3]